MFGDGAVNLVFENEFITVSSTSYKVLEKWTMKDLCDFGYEEEGGYFFVQTRVRAKQGEKPLKFLTDKVKTSFPSKPL